MNPEPCERCRRRSPSTWVDGLWVCYTCRIEMIEEEEMIDTVRAGMVGTRRVFDVTEKDVGDLVPLLSTLTDDAFDILRSVEDEDVQIVFEIRVTEKPESPVT